MIDIKRQLARDAVQEKAKNEEQRGIKLNAAVIAVVIVVVLAVIAIVAFACYQAQSSEAAATAALEAEAARAEQASAAAEEELALQPYSQYYFYEASRSERYLDYQKAHPDMLPEHVVVQVNVDLDTNAYEGVTEIADPSALTVLVSKHFSLPHEYQPELAHYGTILLSPEVIVPLEQLLTESSMAGVSLEPSSGYRSVEEQESLYQGYVASVGLEQADAQSAHPGYSEHQTGLAIDFSPADYSFYDTPEAYWLKEYAYKYGFIVRYTEENSAVTLYVNEPWHIRYVGKDTARFMHEHSIESYEEYWVKYVQHTPPA